MRIEFFVPHVPVAQPRAKAVSFGGHARVYTPTKNGINEFKLAVRTAALAAYDVQSLGVIRGPVMLDWLAVFPRTKGQVWKRRPMPRLPHAKKPDRDNLDKAIMDALSSVIIADDAQVYGGCIRKMIAAGDEMCGVYITMQWEAT